MQHVSLVQKIRQRVRELFTQQGVPETAEICETILIRNGYYCGRRFEAEGAHAIWFCEEQQLKCFRLDGSLLSVESDAEVALLPYSHVADAA
jgi:hypothetical protein